MSCINPLNPGLLEIRNNNPGLPTIIYNYWKTSVLGLGCKGLSQFFLALWVYTPSQQAGLDVQGAQRVKVKVWELHNIQSKVYSDIICMSSGSGT